MADRFLDLLIASLAAALAVALIASAITLPDTSGLAPLVAARLGESGVESAVTAVLLNFRSYDTFLEVVVLLLAVIATRSLHPGDRPSPAATRPLWHGPEPSPLLVWYTARLAPVAILIAGYLWWAGSSRPGGAFQAGTVLGAALALLLIANQVRPPQPGGLLVRLALACGLLMFIGVAVASLMQGRPLLELQPGLNSFLILLIEALLTISIGVCLVALVVGAPVHRPEQRMGTE